MAAIRGEKGLKRRQARDYTQPVKPLSHDEAMAHADALHATGFFSNRAPIVPIHGDTSQDPVFNVDQAVGSAARHLSRIVQSKENIYGRKAKGETFYAIGRRGERVAEPTRNIAQQAAYDSVLGPLGMVKTAVAQIGQRAIDNPAGVYAEATHPVQTAKQVLRNTVETVKAPQKHPGDAALLGFALASGGASALDRAGNLARTGSIARTQPGVAKLTTPGGLSVEYPLSRNPLGRAAMKARNRRLQKSLDAGPRERIPRNKVAKAFVNALDTFGAESKVRRELRANRSVDEALAQGPLAQMHDASRHLNRAEHVAMRVAAIEGDAALTDPTAIPRHIQKATDDFQRGAITADEYHAEVADLKTAAKVLETPSHDPKFLKALARTKALSDKTAAMLQDRKLLDEERGNTVLARTADLYRPGGAERSARLAQLREETGGTRPPSEGEAAHLEQRLAENLQEQKTPAYTDAQKAAMRTELAQNVVAQAEPFTPTHLRALRMREAELRDELSSQHAAGPDSVHLRQLRLEEHNLRERLQQVQAHDSLAAMHNEIGPAPKGSFFFPLSRRYTHTLAGEASGARFGTQTPSEAGSPQPSVSAAIGPMSKTRTGKALESHLPADIVARGVSQRYARTVRLSSAHDLFNELERTGSPVKTSEYQVPYRSTGKARELIKNVLAKASDRLEANPDDAELLTKQEIDALQGAVNADEYQGAPVGTKIDGVQWVDRRMIPQQETSVRGAVEKIADSINNPIRFADLYLRPAYALNAVGNVGMAAVTQGHLAPVSIHRALRIMPTLGEENTALVRAGMGETRTDSYLVKTGAGAGANQKLARVWNKLTDVWFRDSAFLHAAGQAGYKTPAQINDLLHSKDLVGKRREVFRRARKNAVDFQSLTPVEKNTIRRVVYFYPWVSRATVWALRAVVEHPGKVYTLAALARIGGENTDKATGPQPNWLNKVGEIALGSNNKTVSLVNPSSVNTFGSAEQGIRSGIDTITNTIGLTHGGGLADVATPAATLFAQQSAAGADAPQGSGLLGAVTGTPQYQALRRLGVVGKPPATYPDTGVGPALGPLVAGGLYPRNADKGALASQYRRGLSTAERAKQDFDTQNAAIDEAVRTGQIDQASGEHLKQANQADYQDKLHEQHLKAQGHSQEDIDRTLMLEDAKRQGMSLDDLNQLLHVAGYKAATADEYR